jgi:diguanylate cyclase (GGDEF)-like protein
MCAASSYQVRDVGKMGNSDSICGAPLMISPVFYIEVSMVFASLALTVVFFIVWKSFGKKRYALTWSAAFMAATLQWMMHLFATPLVGQEMYWLMTNALAMTMITLGIRGHCQRTECQFLPTRIWPYTAVLYAVIVWSIVISPHTGLRVAIVPATGAITLLLSAFVIIRHREVTRPAEWAAATSMVLFALTQGIAAGMASMQGAAGDPSYLNLHMHFNFLTLPAGFMAMSMFVILMLASDLSMQMKEIAVRDQLTGMLNRRGMSEQGAAAYGTSRRTGVPVSVIMTDIDRFKIINDQFGHTIGDDALAHFSNLLLETRRADDIMARVGGEEFAIVLPGTDLQNAMRIADRLCDTVESTPMIVAGRKLRMTASFGVAAISEKDSCLADTVARADQALYRSKRAGRNQVDLESSQVMRAEDGTLKPISA